MRLPFPTSSRLWNELSSFQIHQKVHGFVVKRVQPVEEFKLVAVELEHERTRAQHVHVFKEDSNNVFSVCFQTAARYSTGVAHILEHTTLCGSEKYNVRDPFFKMLNRSMSTFMNALTGPDFTMYPFSTENKVDYYNLMNVYMDATFAPRLKELDFKQEGWRLEYEHPKDKSSDIVFKGVVYNEMKGSLSDNSNLFWTKLHEHLYPGTPYQYVSGGDPQYITDLTYDALLKFHADHYHPSNARFFTYGDFPLAPRLEFINERISKFDAISPQAVPHVEPLEGYVKAKAFCPQDPMAHPEKQTKMTLSFMTNPSTDLYQSFGMKTLSSLLLDGAAAPMYEALIATNMGSEYAPATGYDDTTKLACVSFGLQGLQSHQVDPVEDKIMTVLQETARKGFPESRIASIIHQMELGLKHRTANFGMAVAQGMASHWVHGGDPIAAMEVAKYTEWLRKQVDQGGYFEHLIDEKFLKNQSKLKFIMEPDQEYAKKLETEEKNRLASFVNTLTEEDKSIIYDTGLKLLASQDAKEDLSCLPTLTVGDIPLKQRKVFPVVEKNMGGGNIPVQFRETVTNGVLYSTIVKDLKNIPDDILIYLPLFSNALAALSTTKKELPILDEEIRRVCGGISTSTFITSNVREPGTSPIQRFTMSSNCLDSEQLSNRDKMYELMREILYETKWDELDRLQTVILGMATSSSNAVPQMGHHYAMAMAASTLSEAGRISELWGGMKQIAFINQLAKEILEAEQSGSHTSKLAEISEKLKRVAQFLTSNDGNAKASIVCDLGRREMHEQTMSGFLDSTLWNHQPTQTASSSRFTRNFKRLHEPIPAAVNFTARAFPAVSYLQTGSAGLQILSSLLSTHFLHREIREKGGAYGGGARYDAINGTFTFWSYRDPPSALENTLSTYDKALEWACSVDKHVSAQEMDEAKLSIFKSVDAPISASEEGKTRFHYGITDEMRQTRREKLLSATLSDVKQAAESLFQPQQGSTLSILGNIGTLKNFEEYSKTKSNK